MSEKRTEIAELGEFGLISKIAKDFEPYINSSTIKGIGDDAAIISANNQELVLSTDMLLEGIHFDLTYVPLKHLGYKAVAVNVSDIAAMNAIPQHITVSIGLSNRFSLEAVSELYEGIKLACENYKIDLIGGDTTSSKSGLVISIAVTGLAPKENMTLRSGARQNDIVCVTGDLGAAYLGLQLLEREKNVFMTNPDMQPELVDKEYLLQRQLRPEARMDFIYSLKELGVKPTSMIDVSDGLASEIIHICNASSCGATLYEDKLPIDQLTYNTAREFNIDPLTCMMNGGEDYELLFTINQKDLEKLKNHPDVTLIGHITDKESGVNIVTKGGNLAPVTAQGWKHF
jgi:thiamine-monophosphate kinase